MIRGRYFGVALSIIFLIRLLLQSQIVTPLREHALPGSTGLFFSYWG